MKFIRMLVRARQLDLLAGLELVVVTSNSSNIKIVCTGRSIYKLQTPTSKKINLCLIICLHKTEN